MLCCAAAQSIPDHPSAGGIYAASEDPPPFSSFDRRRCSSCNPARVRDLLLQFAVVPIPGVHIDAGRDALCPAAAPGADERRAVAQRKLDGHLPVCGEFLIFPESAIRHTQVRSADRTAQQYGDQEYTSNPAQFASLRSLSGQGLL